MFHANDWSYCRRPSQENFCNTGSMNHHSFLCFKDLTQQQLQVTLISGGSSNYRRGDGRNTRCSGCFSSTANCCTNWLILLSSCTFTCRVTGACSSASKDHRSCTRHSFTNCSSCGGRRWGLGCGGSTVAPNVVRGVLTAESALSFSSPWRVRIRSSNRSFSALKWTFRSLIQLSARTCSSLCCWRSFFSSSTFSTVQSLAACPTRNALSLLRHDW